MRTWAEKIDFYKSGCGGATDAEGEKYHHATEALRRLCAFLDIPELYRRFTVPTVTNQDYVELSTFTWDDSGSHGVYSIKWMENEEGGFRLRKESGGTAGRARYFEASETRPPTGPIEGVTFYVREGTKVWLRNTPNEVANLLGAAQVHPAAITSSDLSANSITPQQYDMTLVRLMIGNYFTIHPPFNSQINDFDYARGQGMIDQAIAEIVNAKEDPKAKENLDTSTYLRIRGYSFG